MLTSRQRSSLSLLATVRPVRLVRLTPTRARLNASPNPNPDPDPDANPNPKQVAQLALLTGIALGMAHLHAQLPKPILHHDLKVASESNTTVTLTLPLTPSSPSQSSTMTARLPTCSC